MTSKHKKTVAKANTKIKLLKTNDVPDSGIWNRTSYAMHPVLGKVEVTYVERDLEWSDPPGVIPSVLVGVYLPEDLILAIPVQATPKIKAWREATLKERGIEDTLSPRLKKMSEDLSSRLSRYAEEGRLDEDGCVIYPEDSTAKEDPDD